MSNLIEREIQVTDEIRLEVRTEGIICVYINEDPENHLEAGKKTARAIGEIAGDKTIPCMYVYQSGILPDSELRAFWASEQGMPYSSIEAYVISGLPITLVANVYLKFNKPVRPTRLFNDFDSALNWLLDFA